MWILYDNIAVVMVALLTCSFAWLYGGIVPSATLPIVPWILVFLADIMVCFPQRHRGESLYVARERVWYAMRGDPLTWLALTFTVLLMIPFLNKGLCQICDYAAIALSGASPKPPVPVLPFCVNRADHLTVTIWFVSALTAMVAVKHSLLKRGKRALLAAIVWNGVLLSLIGVIQQVTGAEAPLWQTQYARKPVAYFFSTFGYANACGDYFTTLFGIAMALWRWDVECSYEEEDAGDKDAIKVSNHAKFWRKHIMLVPSTIFFLSAMATLSRAAIILVSSLAVVMFLHSFARSFMRLKRIERLRAGFLCIGVLIAISLVAVYCMPENVSKQFKGTTAVEMMDRVSGRQQRSTKIAVEILKDNFFFGCGGWGFKHFTMSKASPKDALMLQSPGMANVHNDYLQFMVEHGVVGFALLVVMVFFLMKPKISVWMALASTIRFKPPKKPLPRPMSVFVFPGSALFVILAAIATLIHAAGDCPLRSPAVLTLFFVSLAAADGFLPRIKKQ